MTCVLANRWRKALKRADACERLGLGRVDGEEQNEAQNSWVMTWTLINIHQGYCSLDFETEVILQGCVETHTCRQEQAREHYVV